MKNSSFNYKNNNVDNNNNRLNKVKKDLEMNNKNWIVIKNLKKNNYNNKKTFNKDNKNN